MSAGVWSPNPKTLVQANANSLLKEESQSAGVSQRTFTIQSFAYAVGTGSLLVFKNKQKLTRNKDFYEVDSTTVLLDSPTNAGDEVVFVGFVGVTASVGTDPQLRADLLNTTGTNNIKFIQPNAAGAVADTLTKKVQQAVNVKDFGAYPDTGTDQGPALLKAIAYAASINAELHFDGGVYTIGAATSLVLDPTKSSWVGKGPVTLNWTAAAAAGYHVQIVSSEVTPYETVRKQVREVMKNISITGSVNAGASLYASVGLRVGNGVNQTNSLTISHGQISGFTTCLDITNNTWWLTFNKIRFLWGAITSPAVNGNWGENYVFTNCNLLDGVVAKIYYGEWHLFGGSCDNSQLITYNYAYVTWDSPHFENPGNITILKPYIDIQGTQSTVHISKAILDTNSDGSAINLTSPFNVISTNTNCGLIIDGLQYTQNGTDQYFELVSGFGRVRARSISVLSLTNGHYKVIAPNMKGQLRNYGFETGDLTGWTQTNTAGSGSTIAISTTKIRSGQYSALLTATNANNAYAENDLQQTINIGSGDYLMMRFAYLRDYSNALVGDNATNYCAFTAKLEWLDASGAVISGGNISYISAVHGTVDATWQWAGTNQYAPGGTVSARITIANARVNCLGSALLYVDDVYVNVIPC